MNAAAQSVQLVSKLQYNTFEPGEFTREEPRTYEKIVELIEAFPWQEQREDLVIGLTGPSLTIHGKNNDYLKLATYYNRKYVIYYFSDKQILYSKSSPDYRQLFPFIKRVFDLPVFKPVGLKKENTLFQQNLKHFESQDFHYLVTPASILKFLLSTSGINFVLSLFLLPVLFSFQHSGMSLVELLLLGFVIFFMGGGLNLWLFLGYYNATKNTVLVLSKGNPTFFYGEKDRLVKYDKIDIIRVVTKRVQSSRHPANGFVVVTLEMKNSTNIEIPNLLIDHLSLMGKLTGIAKVEINGLPFIH